MPKREPEPLLSEDDNTDTEHLRNELNGEDIQTENSQSEQLPKQGSVPVDSNPLDGNSSSEDQKK